MRNENTMISKNAMSRPSMDLLGHKENRKHDTARI
jgi:hypothetical protein